MYQVENMSPSFERWRNCHDPDVGPIDANGDQVPPLVTKLKSIMCHIDFSRLLKCGSFPLSSALFVPAGQFQRTLIVVRKRARTVAENGAH